MAGVGGLHSGASSGNLSRTLDRVLEESVLTGELLLSGRKLKEFPKSASKYNLSDTVIADLSRNRLCDVPTEVVQYPWLELLSLHHNTIKQLPSSIATLTQLTMLDVSRNQLAEVPASINQLSNLRILNLSDNRLTCLPGTLGCGLPHLTQLDVSHNQLTGLPQTLGHLHHLRSLHLRRNKLQTLPPEVCYLRLSVLDISSNRITALPTDLRFMLSLTDLLLHDNPLLCPPAQVCTRGRVHIFKWLELSAGREGRRGGLQELEHRRSRKHLQHPQAPLLHHPDLNRLLSQGTAGQRTTLDSGYSTSDSLDYNRWSQLSQESNMEGQGIPPGASSSGVGECPEPMSGGSTPSTLSPTDAGLSLEDEFHKAMKQRMELDMLYGNNDPAPASPDNIAAHHDSRSLSTNSSVVAGGQQYPLQTPAPHSETRTPSAAPLTYKDYLEAKRQQRALDSSRVYRSPADQPGTASPTPGQGSAAAAQPPPRPASLHTPGGSPANGNWSAVEAGRAHVKTIQKEAVLSYVQSRVSPTKECCGPSSPNTSFDSGGGGDPSSPPILSQQYANPRQAPLHYPITADNRQLSQYQPTDHNRAPQSTVFSASSSSVAPQSSFLHSTSQQLPNASQYQPYPTPANGYQPASSYPAPSSELSSNKLNHGYLSSSGGNTNAGTPPPPPTNGYSPPDQSLYVNSEPNLHSSGGSTTTVYTRSNSRDNGLRDLASDISSINLNNGDRIAPPPPPQSSETSPGYSNSMSSNGSHHTPSLGNNNINNTTSSSSSNKSSLPHSRSNYRLNGCNINTTNASAINNGGSNNGRNGGSSIPTLRGSSALPPTTLTSPLSPASSKTSLISSGNQQNNRNGGTSTSSSTGALRPSTSNAASGSKLSANGKSVTAKMTTNSGGGRTNNGVVGPRGGAASTTNTTTSGRPSSAGSNSTNAKMAAGAGHRRRGSGVGLPSISTNGGGGGGGVRGTNGTDGNGSGSYEGDSCATPKMGFTYRREIEKQQAEKQLLDNLRNIIESRLKVTLPASMGSALLDGVVLCHLVNHVRPRAVPSIHVPSPAVPKLTVAKCRLNVESFLEACKKIGVEEERLCSADDVLLSPLEAAPVLATVHSLVHPHLPLPPALEDYYHTTHEDYVDDDTKHDVQQEDNVGATEERQGETQDYEETQGYFVDRCDDGNGNFGEKQSEGDEETEKGGDNIDNTNKHDAEDKNESDEDGLQISVIEIEPINRVRPAGGDLNAPASVTDRLLTQEQADDVAAAAPPLTFSDDPSVTCRQSEVKGSLRRPLQPESVAKGEDLKGRPRKKVNHLIAAFERRNSYTEALSDVGSGESSAADTCGTSFIGGPDTTFVGNSNVSSLGNENKSGLRYQSFISDVSDNRSSTDKVLSSEVDTPPFGSVESVVLASHDASGACESSAYNFDTTSSSYNVRNHQCQKMYLLPNHSSQDKVSKDRLTDASSGFVDKISALAECTNTASNPELGSLSQVSPNFLKDDKPSGTTRLRQYHHYSSSSVDTGLESAAGDVDVLLNTKRPGGGGSLDQSMPDLVSSSVGGSALLHARAGSHPLLVKTRSGGRESGSPTAREEDTRTNRSRVETKEDKYFQTGAAVPVRDDKMLSNCLLLLFVVSAALLYLFPLGE